MDARPVLDSELDRSLAVICRNLFGEQSQLLRVDRFELLRTLGRGGMGVVYEARDPERAETVALKMLKNRTAKQLLYLKREFRALSCVAHPNLVALHELYVTAQHAFFTMEQIRGHNVVTFLAEASAEPAFETRWRHTLLQLCEGILALHDAGKLHRDIKPTNVLVTEEGRVVLLDFGLTRGADDAEATAPEGTLGYTAPEQVCGRSDARSDWYSFGCILRDALALVKASSDSGPGSPFLAALTDLSLELLRTDPSLRPDAEAIVRTLCASQAASVSCPVVLHGDLLLGREAVLNQLGHWLTQSRHGPVVVRLRSESGMGKSSVVRSFARPLRLTLGALVLQSRCYERELVPYNAFDAAIDELSRFLQNEPEVVRVLSEDERDALIEVFPVLGQVATPRARGDARTVHAVMRRADAMSALKKLLRRLALERPLLIAIDDAQWSDVDSALLLESLVTRDQHSVPMLVVLCDRGEPASDSPLIERVMLLAEEGAARVVEVELEPLPAAVLTQLVRNWLAPGFAARPELVRRLVAEAAGNPLFAREFSRVTNQGPGTEQRSRAHLTFDAVIVRRLAPLSATARDLLDVLVVAGRPLSKELLFAAVEPRTSHHAALDELSRARLVRHMHRGRDSAVEVEHDRVAHAVLRRMPPPRREAMQARLTSAVHAWMLGRVEPWSEANPTTPASVADAQISRRAGRLAMSVLAFVRATVCFKHALTSFSWSRLSRSELYVELATALEHAGDGLAAAHAYQQAAAICTSTTHSVELLAKAAVQLFHHGLLREGTALVRRVYQQLRLPWPEGGELVMRIARLYTRELLGGAAREPGADPALCALRARILSMLGSSFEGHSQLRTVYNALLVLQQSKDSRDPGWQTRARGLRGLMRAAKVLPGGPGRGARELEEAHRSAFRQMDDAACGDLERQLALACLLAGDLQGSVGWADRCQLSLRRQRLPPRELFTAMGIGAAALYEQGELVELARRFDQFSAETQHYGDLITSFWIHAHPARFAVLFATDNHAEAQCILEQQAKMCTSNPEFTLLAWVHALCRAETELYWGDPTAALDLVETNWSMLSGAFFSVMREMSLLLRLRAKVAAAPSARGIHLALRVMGATPDLLRLHHCTRPASRGIVRLAQAAFAHQRGRTHEALRILSQLERHLDLAGMKLVLACVRHCRGSLLRDDHGLRLQQQAEDVLRAEGIRDVARWVRWIAPGFG